MPYKYLMAPYTHPDKRVCEMRVKATNIFCAFLADQQPEEVYFSPLTHSAGLVPHLSEERRVDHAFWMRQCLAMVEGAKGGLIFPLDGWKTSKGVIMEAQALLREGKPLALAALSPGTKLLLSAWEKYPDDEDYEELFRKSLFKAGVYVAEAQILPIETFKDPENATIN